MPSKVLQDEVVWGVVDRLQRETDPIRKHALRSLLIEQEDRFGTIAERLERADTHIAAGRFRLIELETTTASLRARTPPRTPGTPARSSARTSPRPPSLHPP